MRSVERLDVVGKVLTLIERHVKEIELVNPVHVVERSAVPLETSDSGCPDLVAFRRTSGGFRHAVVEINDAIRTSRWESVDVGNVHKVADVG